MHAPVLALEHEGEQVRLPQLVGLGPLEVLGLLPVRLRGVGCRHVAGLDQRTADRRGTRREALCAQQHRRDPVLAPVGVLLLQHQDRALGRLTELAPRRAPARLVVEPSRPELREARLPGPQRVQRQTHERREVSGRQLAAQPAVEDQQPLLGREARPAAFWHAPPRPPRRLLVAVAHDQLRKLTTRRRARPTHAQAVSVQQAVEHVPLRRLLPRPRVRPAGQGAFYGASVVGSADSLVASESPLPGGHRGVTEQPRELRSARERVRRYLYVFAFGRHRSLPFPGCARELGDRELLRSIIAQEPRPIQEGGHAIQGREG